MKVKYRVKSHEDFQKIIYNNKKVSSLGYVIYFKKNEIENSRVGISTSKKLGNAVVRNRIKRQVRVMARDIIPMKKNMDYVIIVRNSYLSRTYQQNYAELLKLASKIKED